MPVRRRRAGWFRRARRAHKLGAAVLFAALLGWVAGWWIVVSKMVD